MNVNGEYRVAAERERVWTALHDPETLRACIPGCEDVQEVSPHEFSGRVMARVGAVSTVFTGRLLVSDEDFPMGWQISAHAESPSAGSADGTAAVRLSSVGGGTLVAYRIHVDPTGRLASVGDRLLRGVAVRVANDFFARLAERLTPHPIEAEPQDLAEPGTAPPHRVVQPLAPTGAPPQPSAPPATHVAEAGPTGMFRSKAQRIIILVGWVYYAFVLLSMGLALSRHY
ncbi:MAG TPA: carbon monoxide dehydrogenase subunit G [Magnetospirillum sp.]|jgi:carbon monoxide dehydrogenase subunit G|nr:carbon monoxide dehydrogenase subunit G [Magnetospirillum sp.]